MADPKENIGARFVEIYNPTSQEVDLKDWTLIRYNYTSTKNTQALAALPIMLDGIRIPPHDFVIITRSLEDFQYFFGKHAEMASSDLDGNGDDAYELRDPFDGLVDVFGDVTLDGTGTNWEYTDGSAKRLQTIEVPTGYFEFSEWTIVQELEEVEHYSPRVR